MKLAAAFVFAATLLFPVSLSAHSLYLFGWIGKSPVMAALNRNGEALTGWYLYLDVGKELQLSGKIDANGGFQLDETVDGRKTGHLKGATEGQSWTGQWQKPDGGSPLAFAMSESRDNLAAVSGQFRCATKERGGYGWTYAHRLKLDLSRGVVKALDDRRTESSAQDGEQGCLYGLDDFGQAPADVGVLLKAKDEDEPKTEDSQSCTIRIVGNEDYLFLQFGDPTVKNDDCRYSGDTAFCSPRSWPADLIVNRRTNGCKSVGD